MDTTESAPEWEFFERIERLEALKPTADDGRILGAYAVGLSFTALALQRPNAARKMKDGVLGELEKRGISPGVLKWLKAYFLETCDLLEQ